MTGPTQILLPCPGVLFDSDGVLVASDASVSRAWSRWASSLGLPPELVSELVHGRRAADTVALLLPADERGAALGSINALELEDATTVRPVAGARSLTAALAPESWAVVTSATSALARARLQAAGIEVPRVLVTADDVPNGKPAPDGYLAAAERLALSPGECVVVEDSTSGVAAARAAGVRAVLGVGARALDTDADVVVPDLRGVRPGGSGLVVDTRSALRV